MLPKTSSLARSTALAALLLLQGWGAIAQTPEPPKKEWVVGSDELIRIALTNNLSILLGQIQVRIDEFGLNGLYGAYQPSLTVNATHSYDSFPSGFFTQAGLAYPATTEQINSYTPGLSGFAPWGLSYSFTGPLSEQKRSIGSAPPDYDGRQQHESCLLHSHL
jgi:hypothetical protein